MSITGAPEESAKAVQEVAKTTKAVVEATEKAAGFFAKYLDGPLEQMFGRIEDTLRFKRARNLNKLHAQFESELRSLGENAPIRHLPMSFAIPALQEATLEEDDDLLAVWARLLANSVDASTQVAPRRAHVSMLKEMSPFDARVFEAIYSVPPEDGAHKAVVTYGLPECATNAADRTTKDDPPQPSHEVIVSLSNLERIGAISFGSSWGGSEVFDFVNQNTAGYELYKAIKRRTA